MTLADPTQIIDLPARPRRLTILGSTGSIGCNTLDLVARNTDAFEIDALTANENVADLASQAIEHNANLAVIADAARYDELKDALAHTSIEVAAGEAALVEAACRPVDMVMASIVGAAGLAPTLAAVRQGTSVALANKECLVSAGDIFMAEVARTDCVLLPVDSEHSAIFQVFEWEERDQIERIVLTASGGPFREWPAEKMATATLEQALRHPNWDMGRKLTIDSATMMNKGLELIEAHYLFEAAADELDVLVHPQSVIHSMVEYRDGSVLAQLGTPDMRTPISYALAWPHRMAAPTPKLDLRKIGQLSFESVDNTRFPAIQMSLDALEMGQGAPTIMNAANEIAVAAFLAGKIRFPDITAVVLQTLDSAGSNGVFTVLDDLEAVVSIDAYARAEARRLVQELQ